MSIVQRTTDGTSSHAESTVESPSATSPTSPSTDLRSASTRPSDPQPGSGDRSEMPDRSHAQPSPPHNPIPVQRQAEPATTPATPSIPIPQPQPEASTSSRLASPPTLGDDGGVILQRRSDSQPAPTDFTPIDPSPQAADTSPAIRPQSLPSEPSPSPAIPDSAREQTQSGDLLTPSPGLSHSLRKPDRAESPSSPASDSVRRSSAPSSLTQFANGSSIQLSGDRSTRSSPTDPSFPSANAGDRPPSTEPQSSLPQLPKIIQRLGVLESLIQEPLPPSEPPTPSGTSTPPPAPKADIPKIPALPTTSAPQTISPLQTVRHSSSPSPSSDRPQVIQRTPASSQTSDSLPKQWSSLAELMAAIAPAATAPSQSRDRPSPPESSSISPIQAKVDSPIQRDTAIQLDTTDWDEVLGDSGGSDSKPANLDDCLDRLAREVYNQLRLRLERDRERHGNSYNGRLPW